MHVPQISVYINEKTQIVLLDCTVHSTFSGSHFFTPRLRVCWDINLVIGREAKSGIGDGCWRKLGLS